MNEVNTNINQAGAKVLLCSRAMRHGSLFSGIGGFDLAAQWMGWENVFQVEINDKAQERLNKLFPNVTKYRDIKEFDGTRYRGAIDIISGGFPCQPFSTAGAGKGQNDNRYLWPEMLRVITEIQPSFFVAENVLGLLSQRNGMVFETVCTQMEDAGYEIFPVSLPACAVGAQNRRDRIWFVGRLSNPRSFGPESNKTIQEGQQRTARGQTLRFVDPLYRISAAEYKRGESTFSGGSDGLPDELDEIEGLGNAIVPQVAYKLFEMIQAVGAAWHGT